MAKENRAKPLESIPTPDETHLRGSGNYPEQSNRPVSDALRSPQKLTDSEREWERRYGKVER